MVCEVGGGGEVNGPKGYLISATYFYVVLFGCLAVLFLLLLLLLLLLMFFL